MNRQINVLKNLDWLTILLFLFFVVMGWLNIYAVEYGRNLPFMDSSYGKQLLWIAFAIIIAIMLIIIDAKFYLIFPYPVYGIVVFMLIMVLLVGAEIKGARSWFRIGALQLQPSEFAKFATCLALAKFLTMYNHKIHDIKNLLIIGAIIFVPAGLILLQPDAGSMLVYFSLFFMLYREGLSGIFLFIGILAIILFVLSLIVSPVYIVLGIILVCSIAFWYWDKRLKYLFFSISVFGLLFGILWIFTQAEVFNLEIFHTISIAAIITSLIVFVLAMWYKLKKAMIIIGFMAGSILYIHGVSTMYNMLKPHQQTRINVTLGIESDPTGVGWNIEQSKIAIGSGGIIGKGYLQGTHTKGDYVPEQRTDFIFCTIGEEWGYVGSAVIIIFFVLFIIRLIILAERQRSSFSRIYGYGVLSIFFFHIAINLLMTVGLFPVIGIPLPFFSYGGSSLWSFTILLFIFLRLDANRLEVL